MALTDKQQRQLRGGKLLRSVQGVAGFLSAVRRATSEVY